MVKKITDAIKQWFIINKIGLLGFAIGVSCVLAAAGIYRISWELPETGAIPTLPKASVAPTIKPAQTSQPQRQQPQKAVRPKPVLKRLDGPPEPLRRLHEQQNKAGAAGVLPTIK